MQFLHGFMSITGNFRENNEDACVSDSRSRFFIVADGMGGQSAGEKASAIAVELIPQKLEQLIDFDEEAPQEVLRKVDVAVEYANAEIMALGEVESNCKNMGTTLTFILNVNQQFYIGGVGDSRVYRWRDDVFEQLTTDHSLTQALLDAGTISPAEAATHRYRNVLYRYLGTKEGGTGTHAKQLTPQIGDRYLLCSDGVTDGIDDKMISRLVRDNDDPQLAAELVVESAQNGGSKDNITSIVVHVID